MSDPEAVDSDLYNRVAGTMHLLERAQKFEQIARNPDVRLPVRARAAVFAAAIREELAP